MRSLFLSAVLAVLTLTQFGCGGDASTYEGPKRVAIKGKVTLDGEPVLAGSISIIPSDGASEKARKSGGAITNGEFDIPEAQGPNVGKHNVEIRWQKPTGKQTKDNDTGELVDVLAEAVPEKYNTSTELTMEVVEGAEPFSFDLKTE
ncbi:MAG: hypothetical protein R3C01_08935 [Planctomycetaceae bacterium]